MRKLYFTKLIRGIKYLLIFLAVYILGNNVLFTVANFFKEIPVLQILVLYGIPTVITFLMVSSKRYKDSDRGKAYKQALGDRRGNVKAELVYVLKSPDYPMEILAACTYFIVFILFTLLTGGMQNLVFRLLFDLVLFVIAIAVYAVCDLLSWLYVHTRFRRDELI
ncbi:MAG: hypothetical protein J6D87_10185 [Clostridia bacterium]|nr:hypothetical protein [Clostridia bacterium]